MTAAESQLA